MQNQIHLTLKTTIFLDTPWSSPRTITTSAKFNRHYKGISNIF